MFNFNCPVCGLPMVHSRLRGYHCHNESHNQQARDMDLDMALNHHVLTDEEIETALESAPHIKLTGLQERALKAMREAGKRRAVKFN